ncbi:hypothetical protein Tco_1166672 [Tanacetum coccineum]
MSESFPIESSLVDFSTFMRADFSSLSNSLAIMKGNLVLGCRLKKCILEMGEGSSLVQPQLGCINGRIGCIRFTDFKAQFGLLGVKFLIGGGSGGPRKSRLLREARNHFPIGVRVGEEAE